MTDAPQVDTEVDDVDEQHAVRLGKREQMLAAGIDPFPVTLPITTTISEVRQAHPDLAPEAATGDIVGLAGRVVHMRVTGKLAFLSLQEGAGERLQAMVSFGEVGEESFDLLKELVDLGDHVFVSGEVIASKRGELSVMVSEWAIAAKALMPLPNLHSELNEETRVRQRYLDLIVRAQARETVRARAQVNASLRATFSEHGYLEVETPMLQVQHGGASARPFVTHSNAFSTDLFLRIAPELYLKRAVVGGIERVFEINRNFRNEGADSTHSPEFAMLEAYQAYGDYHQMADLTQELIQKAALAVRGTTMVTWADGTEYDLGGQWDRLSLYDSLSDASGTRITPETSVKELQALAKKVCIEVSQPTSGKYVEELWEHFVKESLTTTTFVMDYPLDTSPLVREHR